MAPLTSSPQLADGQAKTLRILVQVSPMSHSTVIQTVPPKITKRNTKPLQYVLFTPAFSSTWIFNKLSINSIERTIELVLLNRRNCKKTCYRLIFPVMWEPPPMFKPEKTRMGSCGNYFSCISSLKLVIIPTSINHVSSPGLVAMHCQTKPPAH